MRIPCEVEIKFLARQRRVLDAIARLRRLGAFRVTQRWRERQRNVCFDTKDGRVRRAGALLRVRYVGRRAVLTFKQTLRSRNHITERIEIAAPVRAQQVRGLRRGTLRLPAMRCAQQLSRAGPLQPVVTFHTDRRVRMMCCGRRMLELVLDRVEVRHGRRMIGTRYEVELEQQSATRAQLQAAIHALRARYGRVLRVSLMTKSAFAFRCLTKYRRMHG